MLVMAASLGCVEPPASQPPTPLPPTAEDMRLGALVDMRAPRDMPAAQDAAPDLSTAAPAQDMRPADMRPDAGVADAGAVEGR